MSNEPTKNRKPKLLYYVCTQPGCREKATTTVAEIKQVGVPHCGNVHGVDMEVVGKIEYEKHDRKAYYDEELIGIFDTVAEATAVELFTEWNHTEEITPAEAMNYGRDQLKRLKDAGLRIVAQ